MSRAEQRYGADLRTALAVLLLALGGTSLARAEGYWTCSGDKWIAVGQPEHPVPLKSCGWVLQMPRTQADCEQAGGRWARAGLFPQPICTMPTHDGGRVCADNAECEGLCLAPLTPDQRALVVKKQKVRVAGTCTPHTPVFGCIAIVNRGFVAGIMCRD